MTFKTLMTSAAAAAMLLAAPGHAQSDAWVGEVMITGSAYCPRTSVEMSGQQYQIAQNQALFSLLGTMYGGDGRTTFNLPDQRGRVALGVGQGPNLANHPQGETGGVEQIRLSIAQMPAHSHSGTLVASAGAPNSDNPGNAALADFPSGASIYSTQAAPNAAMAPNTVVVGLTGGGQPFSNLSPYQVMRVCIFTQGIYPSRN